jgi:hypothetical protein
MVFLGPATKPSVPHASPCFMGRSYVIVSAASLPETLTTRGGTAVGPGIAEGDAPDPALPHPDTAISATAMINERWIWPPPDLAPEAAPAAAPSWR